MRETFDINEQIRDDLKKGLIFDLEARLPAATILAYSGYRREVLPLMQNISHATRAFIWNADGLLGFVQKVDIKNILVAAEKMGQLEQAKEQQVLDFNEIGNDLDQQTDLTKKMIYLSQFYPVLYIFILEHL